MRTDYPAAPGYATVVCNSVLLAMPFGIFGALLAVYLRHFNNDVYFQIGLVTLLGLSPKNAIFVPLFFKLINGRRFQTTDQDFEHPEHSPNGAEFSMRSGSLSRYRSNFVSISR